MKKLFSFLIIILTFVFIYNFVIKDSNSNNYESIDNSSNNEIFLSSESIEGAPTLGSIKFGEDAYNVGGGSGGILKYKKLYSFESVSGDTFTFPTNLVFEKDVVYVAIVEGFVFNLYYDAYGLINADGIVNIDGEVYSVHLYHSGNNNTFSLTGRALFDGSDFPYTEYISQFDICQISIDL